MNISSIETLLIGMVAGTIILTVLIYLRNRMRSFLKISARSKPKFRHSEPNFDGKTSKPENPPEKIVPKPHIIYPLAD